MSNLDNNEQATKDVLDLVHASEGKLRVMGNSRLKEEAAKYPELLIKKSARPKP